MPIITLVNKVNVSAVQALTPLMQEMSTADVAMLRGKTLKNVLLLCTSTSTGIGTISPLLRYDDDIFNPSSLASLDITDASVQAEFMATTGTDIGDNNANVDMMTFPPIEDMHLQITEGVDGLTLTTLKIEIIIPDSVLW